MKKIVCRCIVVLVLCVICGAAYAAQEQLPRASQYVNDYADIIDASTETRLNSFLVTVERKSSAEIAVVTVKTLDGEAIESYAVQLFERWGIGKKGKDNGVLLLVAPHERKMRIEVGYGLEGALPDGLCGEIRDRFIVPYFKTGDYANGIWQGVLALVAVIGKEYNVDLLSTQGISEEQYTIRETPFLARVIGKLLYVIFLVLIFGSRFWFFPFLFGFPRRGYWSGGGSYRSGGFSGGFGGGMSGGGGASGSW